jgi:hypothetical protein
MLNRYPHFSPSCPVEPTSLDNITSLLGELKKISWILLLENIPVLIVFTG